MPCFRSKPAWISKVPNRETGKHPILFSPQGKRSPDYYTRCYTCSGCQADRKAAWGLRMSHEASMHDRNSFLTLTYDQDHYPENGLLEKEVLINFFRRLRDRYQKPIRYFACGEYGPATHRAHYHAIIFGEDFLDGASHPNNRGLRTNPILDDIWKRGMVQAGSVTYNSCNYVAGYVQKKAADKDTFNIMSKQPPIGYTWVQKYKDTLRRLGHCTAPDGTEKPIPPTYIKWLQNEGEAYVKMIEDRKEKIKVLTDKQSKAKRKNHEARQKLYNSESV